VAYTEIHLRDPLFHYTSVEAFQAIASTGKMRFSRSDQTNDPFEVVLVRDVLTEFLTCMLESEKDRERIASWRRVLHSFNAVSDPRKFFISCWSKRSDSLPMWRLYAAEGKGLVFGLRPRAFSGLDCRLTEVSYFDGKEGIFEHIRSYTKKAFGEHLDIKADTEGVPFVVRLVEATLSTKRKEWDYENEFRLSFSYNEEKYDSIREYVNPEIFERMRKFELTRSSKFDDPQYLFQDFGKRTKLGIDRTGSIAEVHLGPFCEWSVDEASTYLEELGYTNFEVNQTKVCWR
jgi:hypothetical protein